MSKFLYALWHICPQIGKLQILHNMNVGVKFGACQFGGVCLICSGAAAACRPFFTTMSPMKKWPARECPTFFLTQLPTACRPFFTTNYLYQITHSTNLGYF